MGCTGSKTNQKKKKTSLSSSETSSFGSIQTKTNAKPILSDQTIENLLRKTKFTQQDIIDWWEGFLSDCPSGFLDKQKFFEVYRYRYPNGKSEKFCEHVFRTFNPNKKNGNIDFEQFMCAIDITLNGTPDEKLAWAFNMYDINRDQRISKSEMLKVIDSMFDLLGKNKTGSNKPKKHVEYIFTRVDLNHDHYLSKDEFILGCKQDEQIKMILAPHC